MGASASLSSSVLAVTPGEATSCQTIVANTGQLVEEFTVEVLGEAAKWSVVEPPSVSLLPGESTAVTVWFRPPRSSEVSASQVPFGIRVASRDDPYGSVVEEGVVDVAPFTAVDAELVPPKAEGSRRARYELAIDNTGNHAVGVQLRAVDQEDELDFRFDQTHFALDPGTAAFIRLQARPRRRFLRGQPVRHRFQVHVQAGQAQPVLVDGTMVQRQLLLRWLVPALIALLAVAAVLVALWLTVLAPAVKSVARDIANEQSQQVASAAQQAQAQAGQAQQQAEQAKQNSNRAMEAAGLDPNNPEAPAPPNPPPPGPPPAEPTDFRLAAEAPITTALDDFDQVAFSPPDPQRTLLITDLILQNPRGDTGTLRILREVDGDQSVLLEVGLANIRDLDHHWQQPVRFRPGERIVLAVSCQNPPERGQCTPSASFSGRLEG